MTGDADARRRVGTMGMPVTRRSILLTSLASSALASGNGPLCWAGEDEKGKDRFIQCHARRQEITLRLDESTFGSLRILIGTRTIIASREQVLRALEDWQAENHAKP